VGLETSLPLMVTAVHDGRLTLERLIELMATNPRRIFNQPAQPDTWVELDVDAQITIQNEKLYTKPGWTPFDGRRLYGRVNKVVLRGELAYENGAVLAHPGFGQVVN
jgi:carbamoyl-phosphate synthase/aspartate carbamoyltransferase/dihydroorotase